VQTVYKYRCKRVRAHFFARRVVNVWNSLQLTIMNELLATCSKYSIAVSAMSENTIKQTIWKVFSHTVATDL